ncbi:hypothetical protein EDB84DRAFT_882941 [Lactarius hengduanensis]|nr:hypothetical protein EDB84DRAFT_882941 [Lactarius hengduanensis]
MILLGRLLGSDLHALELVHPRCVDTGHNPEEDARACIDLVKAEIKNRLRFGGEFWTGHEPILARTARSHSRNRGLNEGAVIVDSYSPSAWHGTSSTAPAMTVACANSAEVLDGLLGAPSCHELIFGRLMELADALGYVTMSKAGADSLPGAENAEEKNRTGAAETKTENADCNDNIPFAAVTNLNANPTALHLALPQCTALLLFSGHSDLRSMSTHAVRPVEP